MIFFNKKQKLTSFNYTLDKLVNYCYIRSVFMDEEDYTKKDILKNIIEVAKLGYSEKKHSWLLNKRTLFGIWLKFTVDIDDKYAIIEWLESQNKPIPIWLNDFEEFINYVNMYGKRNLK